MFLVLTDSHTCVNIGMCVSPEVNMPREVVQTTCVLAPSYPGFAQIQVVLTLMAPSHPLAS